MTFLSGAGEYLRFLLDVVAVAFIMYQIFLLFRGTRAFQALMALGAVVVLFIISNERFLGLVAVNWVLSNFLGGITILLIVLFQEDIRRAFGRMSWVPAWLGGSTDKGRSTESIEEVVEAVKALAGRRLGALMVFELEADLRPFEKGSIPLDAALDRNLLFLLFVPAFENPTHDGAVLIRGNRIAAAHCILPLSQSQADRAMGTRHRAALGLAEQTDALVVVISEETGRISVASEGKLEKGVAPDRLREILMTRLGSAEQQGQAGKQAAPVGSVPPTDNLDGGAR